MQPGVTQISGQRLRGTVEANKEFLLRTVVRGEGTPLLEVAGSLGFSNQPCVSVVIRLAQDRHKVEGGHFLLLGKALFDTVFRLHRVWPNIPKVKNWVARITIDGKDTRFGMHSPTVRCVSDWMDLQGKNKLN